MQNKFDTELGSTFTFSNLNPKQIVTMKQSIAICDGKNACISFQVMIIMIYIYQDIRRKNVTEDSIHINHICCFSDQIVYLI